ncbi:MAG: GldG family protein [Spirochaetia bacterium]|nr:GldG family protein [Spirochaetia bacterium]
MKHSGKNAERALFWLGLMALVLSAAVSALFWLRADLSSGQVNSLSKAARELWREIPESVRVSYYLSPTLRDKHPGPRAVEDFLHGLESVSRGRISARTVDPTEDPSEPEAFGVSPQQLQVIEKSEQRVALVYAGIVIEYLDRHATLPAVVTADTLEYELVKAIRSLVTERAPLAGILLGDDDTGLDSHYRTLTAALESSGYAVRQQERGVPVESDVTVLFVLGNAGMDRYDSFFVDSYLMRGGRVFFAVKGVRVDQARGLAATAVPEGGLLGMLEAYGFRVGRELVLDDSNITVPFQTQDMTGARSIQWVRYPHWIVVDRAFVNEDHPISSAFSGLDLFWPSPLAIQAKEGVSYTELARTTPNAWTQKNILATSPDQAAMFEYERPDTERQYLLAAVASGSLPSAFANGDLPSRTGGHALEQPQPSAENARIVVVSSTDFLSDLMGSSGSTFNAAFAVSAADWLSSDDDLAAIRMRVAGDTRLNRIKDEGARATLVNLSYVVNLGLVPLAVLLYGLLRARNRSRREDVARSASAGGAA